MPGKNCFCVYYRPGGLVNVTLLAVRGRQYRDLSLGWQLLTLGRDVYISFFLEDTGDLELAGQASLASLASREDGTRPLDVCYIRKKLDSRAAAFNIFK